MIHVKFKYVLCIRSNILKKSFVLFAAVSLTGCGVVGGINYMSSSVDQMNARNTYMKSAADYKACIQANSGKQCESQKITMDLDEKTLSQISASSGIGTNVNVNHR